MNWFSLGDEMPAFPSIIIEITHWISKAATCKSHSISGAPGGIQCLWKSRKEKKKQNTKKTEATDTWERMLVNEMEE